MIISTIPIITTKRLSQISIPKAISCDLEKYKYPFLKKNNAKIAFISRFLFI